MTALCPQKGLPSRIGPIPLTVAEYFAGIGLFRMGLEAAGWNVVYANDWSRERAQIYGGFFAKSYPVADVFSIAKTKIPAATLATCSFPCVDLSLAGKLKGIDGEHSGAFWGFYNILARQGVLAPPIVLLENVTGWLSSNGGDDFRAVAKALNDLGYACDAFFLNARCFVPQSRQRLFLIGIKGGPKINGYAFPELRSALLMPPKLRQFIKENQGIRWSHLNLPEPPPYKNSGFSKDIAERIPPQDSRWWASEKVKKHLAMMSPAHLKMVKELSVRGRDSYKTFYRRRRQDGQRAEVRSDDIAGCLRTAIGGSGKQFLVVAGRDKIRMRTLTAREYARLQGVPDSFAIVANSERQALNAFGDAVCVPAVEWIAQKILTPLVKKIYAADSF
jgi:DNA (cytosine-5)-methyltransferase 1